MRRPAREEASFLKKKKQKNKLDISPCAGDRDAKKYHIKCNQTKWRVSPPQLTPIPLKRLEAKVETASMG